MEDPRRRVNVSLVTKWKGRYGAEDLISKPNFHSLTVFNKNCVAIEMEKTQVFMNKPIYIGLCVLDLSKIVLYRFHYNFMLKIFKDKCKLLYTDTDSLLYEIKHEDVYQIMRENPKEFDTSNYPLPNEYGIEHFNEKVVGVMKDEVNGRIILEFIGLRSKMYAILIDNNNAVKKAKGVKSNVVKNSIVFNDYKKCLFNSSEIYREQYTIRSKFHNIVTQRENKLALSPFDDKRVLILNSTDTLPYGHKDVEKIKNAVN